MIITIIIWSYISLLAYVYGWAIVDLFNRSTIKEQGDGNISIPIIMLTGLGGMTLIGEILNFFINLGWLAQVILLAGALLLGWLNGKWMVAYLREKRNRLPWWIILFFVILFITVLEFGTRTPSNPDTAIYHAQAIRWMETYPVIPGLGNLHSRLAYDSTWLILNALFSLRFLGGQSFHALPGVFVMIVLVYFLEGPYRIIKNRCSPSDFIKLILIPITFHILNLQISSPGTDLPATLLIWVIFLLWLEHAENLVGVSQPGMGISIPIIFCFSAWAVTIKLSALPILLIGFLMLIQSLIRNKRLLVLCISAGLIIIMPWLFRNLLLSGYWVYPVPQVAWISPHLDWRVPLSEVVRESRAIQAWARDSHGNIDVVLTMPLFKWLEVWFVNLHTFQKLIFLGALFSPILLFISLLLKSIKKAMNNVHFYGFLAGYLGILFWLFAGPDIRFGYGFLVITPLIAAAPLLHWVMMRIPFQRVVGILIAGMVVCLQLFVLVRSMNFSTLSQRWVLPMDYQTYRTSTCELHNFAVTCGDEYNECGYDPFPCIPPSSAHPQVEMRGPTFREGFRFVSGQ
jgi:hypothetical protein